MLDVEEARARDLALDGDAEGEFLEAERAGDEGDDDAVAGIGVGEGGAGESVGGEWLVMIRLVVCRKR